jgi:hypothetical protein
MEDIEFAPDPQLLSEIKRLQILQEETIDTGNIRTSKLVEVCCWKYRIYTQIDSNNTLASLAYINAL